MKTDREKLEELAADYFLRELSEKELTLLQEGMRADPELGACFVEAARDDWLMNDYQEYRRTKMIQFPVGKRRRTTIRRIAASIAILFTVGTVFVAQRTAVKNVYVERTIVYTPIAMVQEISVRPDTSVAAVNNGNIREVKFGETLFDGDHIVIPEGGNLIYSYDKEDTVVSMQGGTSFTLLDDHGAKLIRLNKGHMAADVAKQPVGKPLRIKTPDAQAVVLGTSLEVLVANITTLFVSEGRVRFLPHHTGEPVEVASGEQADTASRLAEDYASEQLILHPTQDLTIGMKHLDKNISIDYKRNHSALIKFNVDLDAERIVGAELRLRVIKHAQDQGGGGHIRLFAVPSDTGLEASGNNQRVQLDEYSGRVSSGEDLVFNIHPTDLLNGVNAFVVAQDDRGDDIWVSSSRNTVAPQLILKVKNEK